MRGAERGQRGAGHAAAEPLSEFYIETRRVTDGMQMQRGVIDAGAGRCVRQRRVTAALPPSLPLTIKSLLSLFASVADTSAGAGDCACACGTNMILLSSIAAKNSGNA